MMHYFVDEFDSDGNHYTLLLIPAERMVFQMEYLTDDEIETLKNLTSFEILNSPNVHLFNEINFCLNEIGDVIPINREMIYKTFIRFIGFSHVINELTRK